MPILSPVEEAYSTMVNCAKPDHLYHYTTFDGLKGIVESQYFRATHRSYLNDKTELDFGLRKCMQYVNSWTTRHNDYRKRIGEQISKKLTDEIDAQPASAFSYSVSFTEEGDGVAQWQLYGSYGKGLAISLSFDALSDSLLEAECFDKESGDIIAPHFLLNRIEYDQQIQESQVQNLLDVAASCWPQAEEFWTEYPEEHVARYVTHFLKLLSSRTFKHAGYIHECEWRATPHIAGLNLVEFQATRSAMRPYLKMSFDPACIDGIVVGSSVPFDDARMTLELFFQKQDLDRIEIWKSEILLAPGD
jgi:hypothetical protein